MATWTTVIGIGEDSVKVTVTGLKSEPSTELTIESTAVTVPTELLGTDNVSISTKKATAKEGTEPPEYEYTTDADTKYTLSVNLSASALSADQKVVSTAAAWTLSGTTATYAQTVKPKYSATEYAITYVAAGAGDGTSETLATVTNVTGTPNAPTAEGVILVPQNIFSEATITLDDKKGNGYTLQDPTYTQGATEYAWVANGNTKGSFKYQSTTAKNYTLAANAKSITYTPESSTELATISGLKDDASKDDLSKPGASGAITVQGTALKDGDVTLTNAAAAGSNFTLAVDGLSNTQDGTVTYDVTYAEDSGKYTASYIKKTADNYTASGTKITHITTEDETLATVTGLAVGSGVTVKDNVITVTADAIGTTDGNEVAVGEGKGKGTYTLATSVEAPKADSTKEIGFAFKDSNIVYQQPMTAGAVVSEDKSKITYKEAYDEVLATISGLKEATGEQTPSTFVSIGANNVITVKEAALKDDDVTLTNETGSNFTLALDKLTAATSIIKSEYAVSSVTGGTATIQQTDTVRYKVADGAKSIQYDATTGFTATPTDVATVTGLLTSATSGVEVANTATEGKYAVTVHLAALTGGGGAKLTTNTDKFVLKLDEDTQTITDYEFEVTTDGTPKAVYQSFKKSNYKIDGTTITKVAEAARVADTEQILATITGLKTEAKAENFKAGDAVDGVTTITVEAAALAETGEIKIEGTNYKIDVDNSKAITTGTPAWTAGTGDDAGKAIYQRIDKVKYQTASDGKSITYKSEGYELEPAVLATITGIKTDSTGLAGLEFGTGDNAKQITVKSAALDGKDVSIDGKGYTLALDTQTKNTVYEWSVKDGKATYTKYETVNYILKDGKILYSATGRDEGFATPTVLAELDGVNAELNGKTAAELDTYFTVNNTSGSEKITVKAGALTTGEVSLTLKNEAKHTLALDANTASTVNEWNYDGSTTTTAHYQTVTKSNYSLATESGVKKIKYSATLTDVASDDGRYVAPTTAITFTGIKSELSDAALQAAFDIGTTADTTDGKKTVTVKNAALGTSAITTLTDGSSTYKVALEKQTPTLSNEWSVATSSGVTTATYKDVSTVKYTKESDTQIKYTADGVSTKTELFKVSGIKAITRDGDKTIDEIKSYITVKGNVVTLNKAALNGKDVKLEGEGYTLALGDDVVYIGTEKVGETNQPVKPEWQGSGSGEAQYVQPVVTNYTLGEGNKTITYSKDATDAAPVVLATIKGLSTKITKTTSADDLAEMFDVTDSGSQKYTIKLKGTAITGSTYITSQNGKHITNGDSGAGSKYNDTAITIDLYTDITDPDYVVNDTKGDTKKWTFNGTKATYDSVKSPTYTFAKTVEGGTTAAEGNNTIQITGGKGNTNTLTNIITVNGLNAAYDTTTNPFTIDEAGKKVTVAAAALGTSTFTLENKGKTEYTLAIDGAIAYGKHESGKDSAAPTWLVKGGVATYYTADSFDAEKEWGYKIDNDAAKRTITYVAPTLTKSATPAITVSGIANISPDATGTVPGLEYKSAENKVIVSYDALAKKNVTISSEDNDVKLAISDADFTAYGADSDAEFKIYTTTTTPAAATGGDPLLDGSGEETESAAATSDITAEAITSNGTLTVKQSIKKGYTISADSGAIFFTSKANGDTVTLANVTGLNKEAVKGTDYTINETTGKITLLTDKALAEKAVKVTTGHYTLDFDPSGSVTKATTETAPQWVLDKAGTTATYQLKTSAGYTLSDDGKSIAYAKDPTYEVYTKISGLSSNLRDTIDAVVVDTVGQKPTAKDVKAADEAEDGDKKIEAARKAAIDALPATATDAERTAAGDKAAADKLAELLKIVQDNYQALYDGVFATVLAKYFKIGTAASADKPAPITIDAAAFGSSNITIKNSKGHSYSLAVPDSGISTKAPTESSGWYVNGASLSIQTNTGAYYDLDEKAEKITYHKAATAKGSKPDVTISGLKAGLTVGTDGEIAGITKATADGKTTITLSASVLNDKTVKISAGSDKADYKLALSDTTDAVTKSTVANTWEYASSTSTLSLTQGQTEGYVLSDDGTTATYYNGKTGAKVVAKIKGLAKEPTISTTTSTNDTVTGITIDSEHKIITINDKTLLGSSVEFVGKSDYTLAVGSSINPTVAADQYSWVVDEKKKTATYQMKFTADMYVVENGKIVKKTATADDPATVDLITIKGLKTVSGDTKTTDAATDDATATGNAVEVKNGVVYLKADALGTAKVTATGSYKLALYEAPETSPTDAEIAAAVNQDKTAKGNDWLIKGTTATYEPVYKAAYTASDKGDSVTYTAAKKVDNKQEATITLSNLKSGVTASDIKLEGTTITLGESAIGTNPKKPTEVSSGYTLAIDPTLVAKSAQTTSAKVYKGNSVTYTIEQSAGYTLADNKITYAKPVTAKLITISGLAKFLDDEDIKKEAANGGITVDDTAYQSDKTQPITVKVSADVLTQTLNKAEGTKLTTPILSKSVKVTAGKDLDGKTKPTVTLALSDTQDTDNIWYLDGANAKYIEAYTSAHYDLDSTQTKLTYVATAKPTLDATATITVTGLDKKLAKTDDYKTLNLGDAITKDDSTGTVTIDTSVLDKKTTITASGAAQLANGGYTLDFKSGGETLHEAKDAEATWTLGKKAVLKQDQAQGYTLSIDGKTITYQSAAKTGRNAVTVASINGLADKNTVVETSGTNHDEINLRAVQLSNKVTVDSIGYKFIFNADYSGTDNTAKEMNTITGGKNIDKIEAGGDYLNITTAAGNDVIKVTGENNIINGGKGDDYIEVTGGSDNTITYANGDGNDIIKGLGSSDQINLAVFTKAELEKVDKKTEAHVNYVTYETNGSDTVLTLVKNKKTVGTITLKDTSSLSNVKLYAKDGKEFSYEITPTAVSTASGSSGFIGSGNVADEFYSTNYATGSNLGDIISGDSNFSVGDIETGNATDLAKNNTPIITGSNKK